MKHENAVLKAVMQTEKGAALQEKQNRYMVRVDRAAKKPEIKKAVEDFLGGQLQTPAADASGEMTPDPLPPCPHSLPPPPCQGLLQPRKPHTGHVRALQGGASASSAPMSAWLYPAASSRARPPYAPRAGSTEPGAGGQLSGAKVSEHGSTCV